MHAALVRKMYLWGREILKYQVPRQHPALVTSFLETPPVFLTVNALVLTVFFFNELTSF